MRGMAPKVTVSTHEGEVVEVIDLSDYEPAVGQWFPGISWPALNADVREAVELAYRKTHPDLAEHGLLGGST